MSDVGDSNSYIGLIIYYIGVTNTYVRDNNPYMYIGLTNTYVGDS